MRLDQVRKTCLCSANRAREARHRDAGEVLKEVDHREASPTSSDMHNGRSGTAEQRKAEKKGWLGLEHAATLFFETQGQRGGAAEG